MSKKSNAAKNITEAKIPSKEVTMFYRNSYIGKLCPLSDDFLNNLADELAKWAWDNRNNFEPTAESAMTIEDFFHAKGIKRKVFRDWTQRNEKLQDAKEYALEVIGSHRERGALFWKIAEKTVLRTMHHYSKTWKKDRDEDLAKADANSKITGKIELIDPPFEKTEKRKKDERKKPTVVK